MKTKLMISSAFLFAGISAQAAPQESVDKVVDQLLNQGYTVIETTSYEDGTSDVVAVRGEEVRQLKLSSDGGSLASDSSSSSGSKTAKSAPASQSAAAGDDNELPEIPEEYRNETDYGLNDFKNIPDGALVSPPEPNFAPEDGDEEEEGEEIEFTGEPKITGQGTDRETYTYGEGLDQVIITLSHGDAAEEDMKAEDPDFDFDSLDESDFDTLE